MSKIQLVLFDFGGVVINWQDKCLYHYVSENFDISEEILTRECEKNIKYLHSGKIDEVKFWKMIGKRINSPLLEETNSSFFQFLYREKAKLNQIVLSIIKQIKKNGIKVGILSNLEKVTYSISIESGWLSGFDFLFLSHEIGFAKPDTRIYEHVINNVPFKNKEIFFIDDKSSNVEAAKSLGIYAIRYTTNKKLIEELKKNRIL